MFRLVIGGSIVTALLVTYIVLLFKNYTNDHELLPLVAMGVGFLLARR